MPIHEMAKKLRLKPGQRLLLMNAPAGYPEQLSPLPEAVDVSSDAHGVYNAIHLFVRTQAELNSHASSIDSLMGPNGVLWVAFPKGSSKQQTDLTRDNGWEPLIDAGWERVELVSIDDVWSARRFKLHANA